MLGAFFLAREHFAFEELVFGFVLAAPARARNGTVENVAPLYFDKHLRRAADHGDIVQLQIEEIRRGIDGPKLAIDLEWFCRGLDRKALAQHDLKNIPGANVLLRFAHGGQVFRTAKIGSYF